jgi:two-component system, chemotaxis family, protein-glutamate methylesterase/glutaminase
MRHRLVVVGGSLGGFYALKVLLGGLPRGFGLPLAVALHRASDDWADLPRLLGRYSELPIADAEDKQPIESGRVYLAPVGYHLLVEPGSFALSTEGPVLFARPSIDVLFDTAAESYGPALVGIALTGASPDGADGLVSIKRRGGLAVVQDPASAESPVLPRAAIAAAPVDRVLPLGQIAALLVELAAALPRS